MPRNNTDLSIDSTFDAVQNFLRYLPESLRERHMIDMISAMASIAADDNDFDLRDILDGTIKQMEA